MQLLQLPLPLEFRERHPYFIFGRYQADAEMRAAVAEGYAYVHDEYRTTHMDGMVRWARIFENLVRATERFGTRFVNRAGQPRLVWPGLNGEAAEIVVLRGRPTDTGFDTSERGPRSEEHSLLSLMSFVNEEGDSMTTGSYLFHDGSEEEGWCEAWFVAQGHTREGWEHVLCDEAVPLGRIRYLGRDSGGLEPVDVRP